LASDFLYKLVWAAVGGPGCGSLFDRATGVLVAGTGSGGHCMSLVCRPGRCWACSAGADWESQFGLALFAQALEFVESAVVGTFEAGLLTADHGYGVVVGVGYSAQEAGVIEFFGEGVGGLDFHAHLVEASFHIVQAATTPNGRGQVGDEGLFRRGLRLMLGFERFEEGFEVVLTLAFEDQCFGCQSVGDAVETDGGASFRRARAGTFLRVESIRCCLLFGRHGCSGLSLQDEGRATGVDLEWKGP
jgi:hypothetical protein